MGYQHENVHLLFNIWYPTFNHVPSYANNLPQVDHVFPQSLLKTVKETNPKTGRPVQRFRKPTRDQLANCMLLSQEENGAGEKSDTPPSEWFADKDDEYLKMHLIPNDRDLWAIGRFDDFIRERKRLLLERFSFIIQSTSAGS